MVSQCLPFKGSSLLFSFVALTSLRATYSRGYAFLHNLFSIDCLYFFADGHSDRCELIPFCGWICICLVIPYMELIAMYFFFCFLQSEHSLPIQMVSWSLCHILNSFGHYLPQHSLLAGVIYSPAVLVNMKCPSAQAFKLLLRQTATGPQHFFIPHSGY